MNLYFTDSKGKKVLVANDVTDDMNAIERVMMHQQSLFVHPKNGLKISKSSTKATFTDNNGKDLGYSLEND